jgi:hypothetical protein
MRHIGQWGWSPQMEPQASHTPHQVVGSVMPLLAQRTQRGGLQPQNLAGPCVGEVEQVSMLSASWPQEAQRTASSTWSGVRHRSQTKPQGHLEESSPQCGHRSSHGGPAHCGHTAWRGDCSLS